MTEQDEEKYIAIMARFDAAMLAHESRKPVPMCHFKAMIQHWDDSHPAADDVWYECDHCGHTEDSAVAWAKVKARVAVKGQEPESPSAPAINAALRPLSAGALTSGDATEDNTHRLPQKSPSC
jgi:hypothetical protein